MIQVDIGAKTVSGEIRVWRLFPGSHYRFLDDFINLGIGYLDLPGFDFPIEDIEKSKDIIARIAMSSFLKSKISSIESIKDVSLDIKDYANARASKTRGRIRQAIINFYREAKSGDLVIMPEPLGNKKIWVGEFSGNASYKSRYYKGPADVLVPSRGIRWIKSVRENSLSSALGDSLRHQHPFSLVEKDRNIEVMSLAFDSFIYEGQHVATLYNNDEYLDIDSAILGAISKLAAAACWSTDEGRPGIGGEIIDVLIGEKSPADYTCSQESDIHSPGFTRLIGSQITPIVVACLVVLLPSLSGLDKDAFAAEVNNLVVLNSNPGADPRCNAKVSEATKRILNTVDIDTALKLCQTMKASADRAKINSTAKVK